MKIFDLLSELRANPEQNVKYASGHKEALEFLENQDNIEEWGVSMTMYPKLGINPQSQYNTPIGVYFYPAEYYIEIKSEGHELDFQDNAKYIQVLRYDPSQQLNVADIQSIPGFGKNLVKAAVEAGIPKDEADYTVYQYRTNYWLAMNALSKYALSVSKSKKTTESLKIPFTGPAQRNSIIWNKIIRNMGYTSIIDYGNGIIHENEPTQGAIMAPDAIKEYKTFVNYDRKPSPENIPANAESYYEYAANVLKNRFGKGERIIAQDTIYAYKYAHNVVKGPWPEGEDAIAQDAKTAYMYAKGLLQSRFPKGEDAIAQDAKTAYMYAYFILQGRFPKGEDAIAQDAKTAYMYAYFILQGRFPKGEPSIAQDHVSAYDYAKNIIKGPWPAGEKAINSNIYTRQLYSNLLNSRNR